MLLCSTHCRNVMHTLLFTIKQILYALSLYKYCSPTTVACTSQLHVQYSCMYSTVACTLQLHVQYSCITVQLHVYVYVHVNSWLVFDHFTSHVLTIVKRYHKKHKNMARNAHKVLHVNEKKHSQMKNCKYYKCNCILFSKYLIICLNSEL